MTPSDPQSNTDLQNRETLETPDQLAFRSDLSLKPWGPGNVLLRLSRWQYIASAVFLLLTMLALIRLGLQVSRMSFVVPPELTVEIFITLTTVTLLFTVPSVLLFRAARSARDCCKDIPKSINRALAAQSVLWLYFCIVSVLFGISIFLAIARSFFLSA